MVGWLSELAVSMWCNSTKKQKLARAMQISIYNTANVTNNQTQWKKLAAKRIPLHMECCLVRLILTIIVNLLHGLNRICMCNDLNISLPLDLDKPLRLLSHFSSVRSFLFFSFLQFSRLFTHRSFSFSWFGLNYADCIKAEWYMAPFDAQQGLFLRWCPQNICLFTRS